MTGETLFEAITEIRDGLVDEAARTRPARRRVSWLKFGAAAAALAVVIGLGAWAVRGGTGQPSGFGPGNPGDPGDAPVGDNMQPPGGMEGGPGHGEGSVFSAYAGPVLPLAAPSGGEELTAQRALTYDFSLWGEEEWGRSTDLRVTDAYTLTNPTGEDKTVTLLYPFVSSLYELEHDTPALRVDGERAQTALHAGGYAGGFQGVYGAEDAGPLLNLDTLHSWEGYRDLLADGGYLEDAVGDRQDLSGVPVTVYEFTDYWGPEADSQADIPNPTIRVEFDLDYGKTTVLSYGFHGASIDPDSGHMMQSFSIPRSFDPENGDPFYLIVLGEDIANLTTQGYATGGADTTQTVEAGVTVKRYAADLDSALRAAAELMYEGWRWEGERPGFELYFLLMKKDLTAYGLISDEPVARYDTGWLMEMDFEVADRVFYLEASVTIPAGGSATVAAELVKRASYDHFCGGGEAETRDVYGYDLVTRLGSGLSFTRQTAQAVNTQYVRVVRQNYGFDWESGADIVELDPAVEHYYLEVRRAEEP